MAKSKTPGPTAVTVSYDLFELPTAQHKAGLAGLLLLIGSMRERGVPPESIPEIEEVTATSVRIKFSQTSVQALFNDLYEAQTVEVAVESRWPGKTPKREEVVEKTDPESGKTTKSKRFVYDVVQPRGSFLRQHFPDEAGLWLKLWRDMLWAIPRGKPTTRKPFEDRASGKPCGEGAAAWQELQASEKARAKNTFRTGEVAGALLLGAQAVNAEAVPFQGRTEQNLLLHFWQLTILTFVPQVVNQDGEGEFAGYLLAIPEVSDLREFCRIFPQMLHQLGTTARWYRPAAAVIDLPAQGALEFLDHLARMAKELAEGQELAYAVSAIEFFCMVKAGNNIKTTAGGRITPRRALLEEYRAIKSTYRNPLFRSAALLALLRGLPWYAEMPDLFAQRPWPFFVRSEQTPRTLPWFATDASAKFQLVASDHQDPSEAPSMITTDDSATATEARKSPLETVVYRLIQTYVWRKTEDRCRIRYEDFKDKKIKDEKTGKERVNVPREYQEAKEKVCSDAFLALRSRREQDFVDYFTATVCSVGQFLPIEDYRTVAEALVGSHPKYGWEDVKTLAMLALSANS